MAKKYQPSGYQIIDLDLSDKTLGVSFTPETDDEKLLYELIFIGNTNKPILLHLKASGVEICGFAYNDIENGSLYLTDATNVCVITLDSNKLLVSYNEI